MKRYTVSQMTYILAKCMDKLEDINARIFDIYDIADEQLRESVDSGDVENLELIRTGAYDAYYAILDAINQLEIPVHSINSEDLTIEDIEEIDNMGDDYE